MLLVPARRHVSGGELAGLLGVEPGRRSSGMVDRLVAHDLVTRAEDPHDRRVRRISLTRHRHGAASASIITAGRGEAGAACCEPPQPTPKLRTVGRARPMTAMVRQSARRATPQRPATARRSRTPPRPDRVRPAARTRPQRQARSRARAAASTSLLIVVGDGRGGDRPLRVLEAVAGHRADDRRAGRHQPGRGLLQQPGHAGRAAQLDEDADLAGQQPVRGQDLPVGHRRDQAAGGVPGVQRLGPAGRVADPDRGGDRRRLRRPPCR